MLLSTYLAILDDKFLTKVAQVFVDFLGCFKKHLFYTNTAVPSY